MEQDLRRAPLVRAITGWLKLRARESSTWAGMAMIAVALGSDPMAAHGVAQAVSLIIGGGLVTAGPTVRDEARL